MATITVQIGNSDNKLTQCEWSQFYHKIQMLVEDAGTVHFSGHSSPSSPWQNACFVFDLPIHSRSTTQKNLQELREALSQIAGEFRQESIHLSVGTSSFISPEGEPDDGELESTSDAVNDWTLKWDPRGILALAEQEKVAPAPDDKRVQESRDRLARVATGELRVAGEEATRDRFDRYYSSLESSIDCSDGGLLEEAADELITGKNCDPVGDPSSTSKANISIDGGQIPPTLYDRAAPDTIVVGRAPVNPHFWADTRDGGREKIVFDRPSEWAFVPDLKIMVRMERCFRTVSGGLAYIQEIAESTEGWTTHIVRREYPAYDLSRLAAPGTGSTLSSETA